MAAIKSTTRERNNALEEWQTELAIWVTKVDSESLLELEVYFSDLKDKYLYFYEIKAFLSDKIWSKFGRKCS